MGFTYVGPLEGHHLSYLIKNFENIKDLTGPVLVHVITKKGKGYRFAEENPLSYHGVAPFNVETGLTLSSPSDIPTYTGIFSQTIVKLARLILVLWLLPPQCVMAPGLISSLRSFQTAFMMWVLLSSTPSPLPPAWRSKV